MGFTTALKGIFSSKKEDKEAEVALPKSFAELKKGNTFTIDICDVLDLCGKTFQVNDEAKYVISMNHAPTKILTIQSIDTNEIFRATTMTIAGRQFIRIGKEVTTKQVEDIFYDLTEQSQDFRDIFDEDCNASFQLNRFNQGNEETVKSLQDWTAELYSFMDDLGIQGYVEKDGYQEAVQSYFLINDKKDYAVVIENYEDGMAKVYLCHLLDPSNISNFT